MEIVDLNCCGLKELSGISGFRDPSAVIWALFDYYGSDNDKIHQGGYIFSEAGAGRYGRKLAAFITTNNLGTVTAAPAFRNPNSGNFVRTFVWAVNKKTFPSFFRER